MPRGKYQKKPRRNGKLRSGILAISMVLIMVAVAGGTVAYLLDATSEVTNTFTPAEVEIIPTETFTENTKSDIKFTNDGNVPVYIRATLVIYWTDTFDTTDDGVDNPTEQVIPKPSGAEVTYGTTLGSNWFKVGDIYYYSAPVAPDSSTSVMLDTITVTVPNGSTAKCHIDVRSEAIQASPADAVEAAWLDVNVANGVLVSAGSS